MSMTLNIGIKHDFLYILSFSSSEGGVKKTRAKTDVFGNPLEKGKDIFLSVDSGSYKITILQSTMFCSCGLYLPKN